MKITFEIDTENDAFDGNELAEVGRIATRSIHQIVTCEEINGYLYLTRPLFDSNGNCVGTVEISK